MVPTIDTARALAMPSEPLSALCASAARLLEVPCVLSVLSPTPLTPALVAALAERLPEATRRYLSRLHHPLRLQESVLGRALAQWVAEQTARQLTEVPPYSPILTAEADAQSTVVQASLSIAHTSRNGLAVSVAVAKAPIAIDIERLRPRDNLAALISYAFSDTLNAALTAAMARQESERAALALFYRAWGAHECVTKLNRGGSRYRLVSEAQFGVAVLDAAANTALSLTTLEPEKDLQLTVVAAPELASEELSTTVVSAETLFAALCHKS